MSIKRVAASSATSWKSAVTVTAVIMLAVQLAVAQQVVARAVGGRLPRVYNALISTDQRLLPSRADPFVSPVVYRGPSFQYFYDWPALAAYADPAPSPASETSAATAAEDDGRPAAVKNNRPVGTSVPDVPPPPLPVAAAAKKDKKKPEEYPPAPVFAV